MPKVERFVNRIGKVAPRRVFMYRKRVSKMNATTPAPPPREAVRVNVTGIDVPCFDLVTLWVMVALAAIPALVILFLLGAALTFLLIVPLLASVR